MQLRVDEDDAVEELLNDLVLVTLVLRTDLLLFDLGVLVNSSLYGLCVACMLYRQDRVRSASESTDDIIGSRGLQGGRTDASNALNS